MRDWRVVEEPVSCNASSRSGESRTRRTEEVVREDMADSMAVRVCERSVDSNLSASADVAVFVGVEGATDRAAGAGFPRVGSGVVGGGTVREGRVADLCCAIEIGEDESNPWTKTNLLL